MAALCPALSTCAGGSGRRLLEDAEPLQGLDLASAKAAKTAAAKAKAKAKAKALAAAQANEAELKAAKQLHAETPRRALFGTTGNPSSFSSFDTTGISITTQLLLSNYPVTLRKGIHDPAMINLRGLLGGLYASDRTQFDDVKAGLVVGKLPYYSAQMTDGYLPNSAAYTMFRARNLDGCIKPMENASALGKQTFTCAKDWGDSPTHYQCPAIDLRMLFSFFFPKPCSPECKALGARPDASPFAAVNASFGCVVEANNTEILYRALGDTCGREVDVELFPRLMNNMGATEASQAMHWSHGLAIGIMAVLVGGGIFLVVGGFIAYVIVSSKKATPMMSELKDDDSAHKMGGGGMQMTADV